MRKKLAGAAVSTLLVASLLTGSALPAGAVAPTETNAADGVQTTAEAPDYAAYLFVHFIDTEENATKEQIYFSVSTDGYNWATINDRQPVLTSTVGEGGVRDPHIIRKENGDGFAIVATDLSIATRPGDKWGTAQTGGSRNIVVWQSNTINGWTNNGGTAYPIGTEDMLDVWAPESIWDKEKEQYMVTWSSLIGNHGAKEVYNWKYRVYRSYTSDFETFSAPEVYIERQFSVIDTTIYYNEADETYYRFTKNEDDHEKWVFMEKGTSLSGPFEKVSTYRIDDKYCDEVKDVEGPTVFKANGDENKWFLLLDNWSYIPYETADITKGDFHKAGDFRFNGKTIDELRDSNSGLPRFRHGSVLPITQEEYEALCSTYHYTPPTPDKTSGDLIYELTFEENLNATTGGDFDAVQASAEFTYVEGEKSGTHAAEFKDNKFLTLPGDVFKGKDNLTITFNVKVLRQDPTSWLFFAAPNANEMKDPRNYFGTLYKKGGVFSAERYLDQGWSDQLDAFDDQASGDNWVNLTIVYYKTSTKMFINGQPATGKPTVENSFSLSAILGETPTVYIGKATWTPSGEYSLMNLDRFRVYDYAMSDEDVAAQYAADNA